MPKVHVIWTETMALSATFDMTDEEVARIEETYDDVTDYITNMDEEKYNAAVDRMDERIILEANVVEEGDNA